MRIKSLYIIIFLLSFSVNPHMAFAEEKKPTETVRELLKSISMIKDESINKLTPQERKNNKKLMNKASSIIYIFILGPKTLGSHWEKRTPKEKENFLAILTRLFEKVAYPKSAKFFTDLQINYDNEIIKKGEAEVQTSMEHESEGLIEIGFKLHKINGKWLIYDVILDEVSLVLNLKAQFHKVIEEESFGELIKRMNERLEKED